MRRLRLTDGPKRSVQIRRASRVGWPLIVMCLCALSGCRELIAPPLPPTPDKVSGPVLLLDLEGEPDVGARVRFANDWYVGSDERLRWEDTTDSNGYLFPKLPAGRYWMSVNRSGDLWERAVVDLQQAQLTIDPRPWVQRGVVTSPVGFPAEGLYIEFRIRVQTGTSSPSFRARTQIEAAGEFTIVWAAEGEYEVSVRNSIISKVLDDAYTLPRPDPLQFGIDAIPQEVVLTLAGADLPAGSVVIRAEFEDGRTREVVTISGSSASYWAEPGPGLLSIDPGDGMPFLHRSVYHDFREAEVPTIELGDHLVEFLFFTPSGVEVVGCNLDLVPAETGRVHYRYGLGNRESIYLRGGQYAIRATLSGFLHTDLVINVTQDNTVTVLMHPESTP